MENATGRVRNAYAGDARSVPGVWQIQFLIGVPSVRRDSGDDRVADSDDED